MKLPNANEAFIDIKKLRDYCLSYQHRRGQHKARVFEATLGLTATHTQLLRDALIDAALREEVISVEQTQYGQRYTLDFDMIGPNGKQAVIRSGWIIRKDENFPRLTTCFVR